MQKSECEYITWLNRKTGSYVVKPQNGQLAGSKDS